MYKNFVTNSSMIKFHERIRNSKASKILKKKERGGRREKHDEKLQCLSD